MELPREAFSSHNFVQLLHPIISYLLTHMVIKCYQHMSTFVRAAHIALAGCFLKE